MPPHVRRPRLHGVGLSGCIKACVAEDRLGRSGQRLCHFLYWMLFKVRNEGPRSGQAGEQNATSVYGCTGTL